MHKATSTETFDDRILYSRNLKAVKEGYLTKQGQTFKTWRKRWFLLNDFGLSYYKSPEQQFPLGYIAIEAIKSVDCPQVSKHTGKSSQTHNFNITTPQRTYVLTAETSTEVKEWMEAINNTKKKVFNDMQVLRRNTNPNTKVLDIDEDSLTATGSAKLKEILKINNSGKYSSASKNQIKMPQSEIPTDNVENMNQSGTAVIYKDDPPVYSTMVSGTDNNTLQEEKKARFMDQIKKMQDPAGADVIILDHWSAFNIEELNKFLGELDSQMQKSIDLLNRRFEKKKNRILFQIEKKKEKN